VCICQLITCMIRSKLSTTTCVQKRIHGTIYHPLGIQLCSAWWDSKDDMSNAHQCQVFPCRGTQNTWLVILRLKLKLSYYTPRRRLGERRYSSCSFSTSALDGGVVSVTSGCALPPGKEPRYPLYRRRGGPQSGHKG
jgi:hypothetical protein